MGRPCWGKYWRDIMRQWIKKEVVEQVEIETLICDGCFERYETVPNTFYNGRATSWKTPVDWLNVRGSTTGGYIELDYCPGCRDKIFAMLGRLK